MTQGTRGCRRPLHGDLVGLSRRRVDPDVPRVPRGQVPRRLRRLGSQRTRTRSRTCSTPSRPTSATGTASPQPPARGRRHRRRGHLPQHRAAVLPELRAVRRARPTPERVRAPRWPASAPTTAGWPTSAPSCPGGAPASARSSSTTSTTRIDDVRWIKEHGLRGGVLIPTIAPDVNWVKPLYDPVYDPLWAVCEELGVPVNMHGGTGVPNYGPYAGHARADVPRVRLVRAATAAASAVQSGCSSVTRSSRSS